MVIRCYLGLLICTDFSLIRPGILRSVALSSFLYKVHCIVCTVCIRYLLDKAESRDPAQPGHLPFTLIGLERRTPASVRFPEPIGVVSKLALRTLHESEEDQKTLD